MVFFCFSSLFVGRGVKGNCITVRKSPCGPTRYRNRVGTGVTNQVLAPLFEGNKLNQAGGFEVERFVEYPDSLGAKLSPGVPEY